MKTVPLSGKKARGRVVRVDDKDYELVGRHRWYVHEVLPTPGRLGNGPYAMANYRRPDGSRTNMFMHCLIMGQVGIDHRDHDGLNNQRSNLRPATERQNHHNQRSRLDCTSKYKGVFWNGQKRRWQAQITVDGNLRYLGLYVAEMEAALAYDDAALKWFGEFACPNFPEGAPRAVRDQLRAEREAADADRNAAARRVHDAKIADWWKQREPETRTCTVCGAEYQTKVTRATLYCGGACCAMAKRRRDRERAAAVTSR